MSARRYLGPGLLIGGGIAAVGAVWYASRKATQTTDELEEALSGTFTPGRADALPKVKVRATGYWPFTASAAEKKMEGGVKDRKGKPLYTLEQHLSDPSKAPYVSVSGDDAIWPYGQRIAIDAWPQAVFRVVDTGSHFRGLNKVYRVAGYEPLDVCVASDKTPVPKLVTATIYPGDNYAKGQAVASAKFKDQSVAGTVFGYAPSTVEARTTEDHRALACVLESELGQRSDAEMFAAGCALRNQADADGTSVGALVRNGVYSTRKEPSERALRLADEVLGHEADPDPTFGAVDFWQPHLQAKMRRLGDIHRAALAQGDEALAKKYERYAKYGSVDRIRQQLAGAGLSPVCIIGAIEFLRRA